MKDSEVVLGGELAGGAARAVVEYRKRFNRTAHGFARAWGGYNFKSGQPDYGGLVGIRWEW